MLLDCLTSRIGAIVTRESSREIASPHRLSCACVRVSMCVRALARVRVCVFAFKTEEGNAEAAGKPVVVKLMAAAGVKEEGQWREGEGSGGGQRNGAGEEAGEG